MSSESLWVLGGAVLVGALWGCTNPLMARGGRGMLELSIPPVTLSRPAQILHTFARQTAYLFSNWRFVLPFVANQLGSVLFVGLLGRIDLSLAVPACNALAMVFTALTSQAIGEEKIAPGASSDRSSSLTAELLRHCTGYGFDRCGHFGLCGLEGEVTSSIAKFVQYMRAEKQHVPICEDDILDKQI